MLNWIQALLWLFAHLQHLCKESCAVRENVGTYFDVNYDSLNNQEMNDQQLGWSEGWKHDEPRVRNNGQ